MTRPLHVRIDCHACGVLLTSIAPCPSCGAPAKPPASARAVAAAVLIARDRGEDVRALLAGRCRTAAEARAACAAIPALDYDQWEQKLQSAPVDPLEEPEVAQMFAEELSAIRRARDEIAQGVLPGALDGELAAACADLEAERVKYGHP